MKSALVGAVVSVVLGGGIGFCVDREISDTSELRQLEQTFDGVAAEYFVASKVAWLDVVQHGYPKDDDKGFKEKSARQIDYETKQYASYLMLETRLTARCTNANMKAAIAELRCANYRVYALYDAVEEDAETVAAEAAKHPKRVSEMKQCSSLEPLLKVRTSDRHNLQLNEEFDKQHAALLRALNTTRALLADECD